MMPNFKKLLLFITISSIHTTASPLAEKYAAIAITVNENGAFKLPLNLPNGHYTLSLPTGNKEPVSVYPKVVMLEKDAIRNLSHKPYSQPSSKQLRTRHHTFWSPLCIPEIPLITQDSYHYIVKATPNLLEEYWSPEMSPPIGPDEMSLIQSGPDFFLFCNSDKSGKRRPALASEYYEADGTIDGVCGSRRSGGAGQVGRQVGYLRLHFDMDNTTDVTCRHIVYLGARYESVGELVDGYMRDSV